MSKVIYGGQSYDCGEQSVLDCLTAQGVPVPSSCRAGLCHACMMRAVKGKVPDKAKIGLKATLAEQNFFLPCCCYPEEDIEVVLREAEMWKLKAKITGVEFLNADILGISIKPSRPLEYRAGQFINFFKSESTTRCYSLASVPALDDELSVHVRKVPGGEVSNWIFNNIRAGDVVTISEAEGDCFYVPGNPKQNILLVATGSGLAPLYGIIRDALSNKHKGKLCLFHGSNHADGLYMVEKLRQLEKAHSNFKYVPCVSDSYAPPGHEAGMVLDVALKAHPQLSGWRVFLCGNPDMVNAARKETFVAGASMSEIFADPF